jgi:hypothetical protein
MRSNNIKCNTTLKAKSSVVVSFQCSYGHTLPSKKFRLIELWMYGGSPQKIYIFKIA